MTISWRSLVFGFLFSGLLLAQSFTVGGDIPQPMTFTKDDLAKMPRSSASWAEHGQPVNYEGVTLYEILKKAGAPFDRPLSGKAIASYVLIDATDGYEVVFALPELDPAFNDHKILLADTADGGPLPSSQAPFRLIVPQDRKGARSIRMIQKITLVRLRK